MSDDLSIDLALPGTLHTAQLPVPDDLRAWVSALIGVEMKATGPMPLAIAPHDTMVLSVQFALDRQGVEAKNALGSNTCFTGIRNWTGKFTGAGDCMTLLALLTPLGSVQLLNSRRLDAGPPIRVPLAQLLDSRFTRSLESCVALAQDMNARLHCLASWLEQHVKAHAAQERAALRAARAAMRLCADPARPIDDLADDQHVCRRQIERDFSRWLGVSPRHLSQVARLQGVARHAHAGATLADAAAAMQFTDQAHMSHVVRRLTGLTPRQFVRGRTSPLPAVFRAATGGGVVYL